MNAPNVRKPISLLLCFRCWTTFNEQRKLRIQAARSELIGEGVRRTAESFENALAAAGVDPIKSVGELFDPELHEAVDTIEVEPEQEGEVIREYSRGYRLGERLLRPARVKVGRAAKGCAEP